jgi:DHA2 family multidrug resistance protein
MMRQLGGSFGVAIISTFLVRDNQFHRSDLLINMDVTNPKVQQRIEALSRGFQGKGMPWDVARKTAISLQERLVDVQATVLSYMDVFLWIGVMFLVCVPFVIIFVKKSRQKVSMSHVGE